MGQKTLCGASQNSFILKSIQKYFSYNVSFFEYLATSDIYVKKPMYTLSRGQQKNSMSNHIGHDKESRLKSWVFLWRDKRTHCNDCWLESAKDSKKHTASADDSWVCHKEMV